MLTLMSGSVSAIQLFAPPYVAHSPGLTQSRKNTSCFFPSHSDGLGWMGLGLTFCLFINLRSKECQGRVAEVYAGSCSPSCSFSLFLLLPVLPSASEDSHHLLGFIYSGRSQDRKRARQHPPSPWGQQDKGSGHEWPRMRQNASGNYAK